LVGISGRNKPFGKPTLMWDGNLKMVLKDVGGGGVNWIYLV
jgi:hypothetical protein